MNPVKTDPSTRIYWVESTVEFYLTWDLGLESRHPSLLMLKHPCKVCVLHITVFTNEHQIGGETRIFKILESARCRETLAQTGTSMPRGSEGAAESLLHFPSP